MKPAAAKKVDPKAPPKPSLSELSARWARAKVAEETAKREAERLKKELLEAGATIGYEDEHLVIGSTSDVDTEDKKLMKVLDEIGALEQVTESRISTKKLRALAELNESVARAIAAATSTRPRFEQAAKK